MVLPVYFNILTLISIKVFKGKMREMQEAWLTEVEVVFTRTGKRKRASYEMVAEWVSHACNSITTNDYIMKGSRGCGYHMWDGEPDSLFFRLAETLKNGKVSQEIRDDVDEEIEGMLASIADEADADVMELAGPVNERVYDMDTDDSFNDMES